MSVKSVQNLDEKRSKGSNLRWLTSKEAMKALKVSGCDLMHRRERGELQYRKQGNAYYYAIEEEHISSRVKFASD